MLSGREGRLDVNPRSKALRAALIAVLTLASCMPTVAPVGPEAARATMDQGMALLSQRRFGEAKQQFAKLAPLRSGDARALMGLAIASDMEGDFRTADSAYEKLLVLTPDQPMLYNNMGYSYMLRGDLTRAHSYLAEAARRDPGNDAIQNNLKMLRGVMPLQ